MFLKYYNYGKYIFKSQVFVCYYFLFSPFFSRVCVPRTLDRSQSETRISTMTTMTTTMPLEDDDDDDVGQSSSPSSFFISVFFYYFFFSCGSSLPRLLVQQF